MVGGELAVLAIIFLTSAVIAIALGVVWRSFGRPRHALFWSLAFVAAALETLTTAAADLRPGVPGIVPVDLLLTLLAGAMVTTGAIQRAHPARRVWWPSAAALAILVVALAAYTAPALRPFAHAGIFVVAATFFILAARALVPEGRPTEPAERMAIIAILVFAALEIALAACIVLRARYVGDPRGDSIMAVARWLYLIGHPSLSVAAGIAAILLVASDLAGRLRQLATFDTLTEVHNRRGFEEAALRAIAAGQRSGQKIAIAIADIDHFKAINDQLGHSAGDETLRHVARCLADGVRAGDLVGRVGGEEFALLLLDADAVRAAEVLDRLRAEIADGFGTTGAPARVTLSFGVAAVAAETANAEAALDAAVADADRALYAAKHAGRDRTTIAA